MLPLPRAHTRPRTPTLRCCGQVANTGLGSFYGNREAVAENAFSIEENKTTLCVCVCAYVHSPGAVRGAG